MNSNTNTNKTGKKKIPIPIKLAETVYHWPKNLIMTILIYQDEYIDD